jgi:hypothetical protein
MRVRPDLQGREQTTVGIVMPYLAGAHGRLRPCGSSFGSSDYSHTQWAAKVRWSSTFARLPRLFTDQDYPEDSSRRHLRIIADLSSRLKAKRISLNQAACESVQCYLRCRPRYRQRNSQTFLANLLDRDYAATNGGLLRAGTGFSGVSATAGPLDRGCQARGILAELGAADCQHPRF